MITPQLIQKGTAPIRPSRGGQGLVPFSKEMSKFTLLTGNIVDYTGDAIICPCDVELSNDKVNSVVEAIFEQAGTDLLTELLAIGFCGIGHAVIVGGYKLNVKSIIFYPYKDSNNPNEHIDSILMHQAIKAVFSLVRLYHIKNLAISLPLIRRKKKSIFERILDMFSNPKEENYLSTEQIMCIVTAIAKENEGLKEVAIFR
ncbi:macro domain-containing protein [Patescibacteria group bacterium]|nr:macro domain-containing protein [Patescibacteria group bacterium]